MIYAILDNQDYMGGSWYNCGFFDNKEAVDNYIKEMMVWSGNISVVETGDIKEIGYTICKKYNFDSDYINAIKSKYQELTGDTSNFRWLMPY